MKRRYETGLFGGVRGSRFVPTAGDRLILGDSDFKMGIWK